MTNKRKSPQSVPKDESELRKIRWNLMDDARRSFGNGGYAEDFDEGFKKGFDEAIKYFGVNITADVSRVKHTTLPDNAFESGPTDLPESAFNEPASAEQEEDNK